MASFGNICGLRKYIKRCYKSVFHRSTNCLSIIKLQSCEFTKKSAEEQLGIEKPKRPLNPFFKFMTQMRPALITKIPGISTKEAMMWGSKHWQQLDHKTKSEMKQEYKNDLENYKKIKVIYEASLTEEQKRDIKRLNSEMIANREKRKLKAELMKMGKPKKPMSSYFLYAQSRNDIFKGKQLKEYQENIKKDWLQLQKNEKDKLEKQAQDLMKKYRKEMEAWELKMISMGHTHLIRQKPHKRRIVKNISYMNVG